MRDSDGLCPEQTAVGKVGKCDDFQTGSAAQSCVIALPAWAQTSISWTNCHI